LNEDDSLYYNTSVIPSKEITEKIYDLKTNEVLTYNDEIICGRYEGRVILATVEDALSKLTRIELKEKPILLNYPWDLVSHNSDLIKSNFKETSKSKGEIDSDAFIIGDPKCIYIGKNSTVEPGTILDVREGPVIVDDNTVIRGNSRIEGPVYVGKNCTIGGAETAILHEGACIGDVCKIGGEVEETIIHDFTNKAHFGFLGHSVVGSWVNIGAGATNSDLKSNYGEVKIEHISARTQIKAGRFVGTSIGDFSKINILSRIMTGKQIGYCSLVGDTIHSNVPSFTFYHEGNDTMEVFRKDKAIEMAMAMMERREEYIPHDYVKAQLDLLDVLFMKFAKNKWM
jgi:UDP-N-acetylglucosamine diphosphorylase/glucosamine-1-phosphate N-acetyltransferase